MLYAAALYLDTAVCVLRSDCMTPTVLARLLKVAL